MCSGIEGRIDGDHLGRGLVRLVCSLNVKNNCGYSIYLWYVSVHSQLDYLLYNYIHVTVNATKKKSIPNLIPEALHVHV